MGFIRPKTTMWVMWAFLTLTCTLPPYQSGEWTVHCTSCAYPYPFPNGNCQFRDRSSVPLDMNLTIVCGVVGNILSVVGVVIINKYITGVDGYNYMIFLSFLHFLFTTIGTRVLLSMGAFQYKDAPLSGVLPVSLGSLLSVAFMNLNLAHNSVGFYQVMSPR